MATTHALVGVLVGLALAPIAPESATAVVMAGAVGGAAPDLDAIRAHRRTLHLPLLGTVAGLALVAVALPTRVPWAVALAAAVLAAGLHALTDVLDGGLSLRPWAEQPERAVYCHLQGRWWRPWRLFAYDGSPGDLGLAAILALPAFLAIESGIVRGLLAGLLVVSIGYAALRRRIPDLVESLAARSASLPARRQ